MRSILLIVAGNVLAAALGALVMLGLMGDFGARREHFSTSAAAGRTTLARPAFSGAPGTLKTDGAASKVNPAQAALTGPATPEKAHAPAPALAGSEQTASGAASGPAAGSAAPAAGAAPVSAPAAGYRLQVAAFESPVEAAQLQKALAGRGFSVTVETVQRGPRVWRIVEVAGAGDRMEAAAIRARLQERSGLDAAIVGARS